MVVVAVVVAVVMAVESVLATLMVGDRHALPNHVRKPASSRGLVKCSSSGRVAASRRSTPVEAWRWRERPWRPLWLCGLRANATLVSATPRLQSEACSTITITVCGAVAPQLRPRCHRELERGKSHHMAKGTDRLCFKLAPHACRPSHPSRRLHYAVQPATFRHSLRCYYICKYYKRTSARDTEGRWQCQWGGGISGTCI